MADRISTSERFLDYCIEQRIDKKSFLSDVDRIIDWKATEKLPAGHYRKTAAATGRPFGLGRERIVKAAWLTRGAKQPRPAARHKTEAEPVPAT